MSKNYPLKEDFACVDETHYLHIGINPDTGKPCNSSVGPAAWEGRDEDGWSCLGCNGWWPQMPPMEEEGLAALARLRHEEEEDT